jgi:hypothetical protein
MVHQDSAHYLRRDPKEVSAILPLYLPLIDELDVRLMYERCRLKRMIASLATEIAAGKPSKFVIYERVDPIDDLAVAVRQVYQHLSYLM